VGLPAVTDVRTFALASLRKSCRGNLPHATQPYLDNSCDSGIGLFDAIRQSLSPQFPHGPV
jgi:hypothetical protein